jgi:hypothetical protein
MESFLNLKFLALSAIAKVHRFPPLQLRLISLINFKHNQILDPVITQVNMNFGFAALNSPLFLGKHWRALVFCHFFVVVDADDEFVTEGFGLP